MGAEKADAFKSGDDFPQLSQNVSADCQLLILKTLTNTLKWLSLTLLTIGIYHVIFQKVV